MTSKNVVSPLPIRGAHIDCRAQMLHYDRIVEIFGDLARWGFNTVLFEYENRFPFRGRLRRAAAEDSLTREQVRGLVKIASSLGLKIIPLVHCLGHLEYVLHLPGLRGYAEPLIPSPFLHVVHSSPHTVCPSHSGSRALFREMAEQVLELHPDCRYFHMGGDEAELNSACPRCGDRIRNEGMSDILVEHYIERADWLRRQGPDPIIWCDMPLSNPEAIDRLRGHVTIMDWDYWSLQSPATDGRVWGAIDSDFHKPETWPPVHRKLFAEYILTDDGRATPFPYARFWRDRGFQVIVAPAIRSGGDTFCAPARHHIENTIGAVQTAHANHLLGSVITSWALRRAPWPLTEYGLIAGGMTMADPRISRKEIDTRFAEEHFGNPDPTLAGIPRLLGNQLQGYLDSLAAFDPKSGGWPGLDYTTRIAIIRRNSNFLKVLAKIRSDVRRANKLLEKAKPMTPRQRERTRLWKWAGEVLSYFAEFGPQLFVQTGKHDALRLKAFRKKAGQLAKLTHKVLSPIYTERTMREEHQTRFGIHFDYLDEALRQK